MDEPGASPAARREAISIWLANVSQGFRMPTCKHCKTTFAAEDLVRHEKGRLVVVHCPDCKHVVGTYNRHSGPPRTDNRA